MPFDYTQKSIRYRTNALTFFKGNSANFMKKKPRKKKEKNCFTADVLPLQDLKNSITELVDKNTTVNEMIKNEKIKILEEKKNLKKKKEEEELERQRHRRVSSLPENTFKQINRQQLMMTDPKQNIQKNISKNKNIKIENFQTPENPENKYRLLFERKQSFRLNRAASKNSELNNRHKTKEEKGVYRSFIKKFAPGIFRPPDILKINGKIFRNKSINLRWLKNSSKLKIHDYEVKS